MKNLISTYIEISLAILLIVVIHHGNLSQPANSQTEGNSIELSKLF